LLQWWAHPPRLLSDKRMIVSMWMLSLRLRCFRCPLSRHRRPATARCGLATWLLRLRLCHPRAALRLLEARRRHGVPNRPLASTRRSEAPMAVQLQRTHNFVTATTSWLLTSATWVLITTPQLLPSWHRPLGRWMTSSAGYCDQVTTRRQAAELPMAMRRRCAAQQKNLHPTRSSWLDQSPALVRQCTGRRRGPHRRPHHLST
jgi:hypothetical protein